VDLKNKEDDDTTISSTANHYTLITRLFTIASSADWYS